MNVIEPMMFRLKGDHPNHYAEVALRIGEHVHYLQWAPTNASGFSSSSSRERDALNGARHDERRCTALMEKQCHPPRWLCAGVLLARRCVFHSRQHFEVSGMKERACIGALVAR